jgi:hypothetical protein
VPCEIFSRAVAFLFREMSCATAGWSIEGAIAVYELSGSELEIHLIRSWMVESRVMEKSDEHLYE